MILAADIGGTKSLFALCHFINNRLVILEERRYSSKDLRTLAEFTAVFLNDISSGSIPPIIESACFSLAGPIQNDICNLVNLNLTLDLQRSLEGLSFIPNITFCNDLEAVGHGLSLLSPKDLCCITPANTSESFDYTRLSNKVILAPGTGLGEAFILEGKPFPSEGAHCEFGPRTEEQVRLWQFLHQRFGHVSYERLLSGPGLLNIYDFLWEEKPTTNRVPLVRAFSPEEISGKALSGHCPLCQHALDLFVSVLGAEAGNLALKILAFGGVYLGGGIPPQILPKLQDGTFLNAFQSKGRLSGLLEQIPVFAIMNSKTALFGAALLASRNCQQTNT